MDDRTDPWADPEGKTTSLTQMLHVLRRAATQIFPSFLDGVERWQLTNYLEKTRGCTGTSSEVASRNPRSLTRVHINREFQIYHN